MRALVTGARGFVGTHLVGLLAAHGDEVITTDRSDGGPDLTDRAAVDALVADAAPTVIYHLAGQADVAASWRDPIDTFHANATGTLHLLEAASQHGVDRVVAVTSAEVYGKIAADDLPISESLPLAPASPYAASKAAAEMLCAHYAAQGLGVVRARAFNHLGPGQSERFVAPALAARVLRAQRDGVASISVGRLDTRRDFTDVRDVVRAYRCLATDGTPGEAYNVCSGVDRSIADVVASILDATGAQVELTPDPDLQRPSDLPVLRGDNTKIAAATGWQPTIDFSTTIADLVDDLRSTID